MNFLTMEYFVEVARQRSFTHAAERLHITQQTLSAHIAAVERELGCRLLVRTTPLQLTYAGQVFLRYADDFQQRRQRMMRELGDIAENRAGLLRVGVTHTRGRAVMPRLIEEYHHRRPQITVQLIEAPNDALQQALMQGQVDLAIANLAEGLPGVALEDFYREEVILLAPRALLERLYGPDFGEMLPQLGQEGGLARLAGCPFLLNSEQDISGRIGRMLMDRAGLIPQVAARAENIETVLDLCARGVGACFCPANLVVVALSAQQAAALVRVPLGSEARCNIRFGYLRQTPVWSAIPEFIALAKEGLGGSFAAQGR